MPGESEDDRLSLAAWLLFAAAVCAFGLPYAITTVDLRLTAIMDPEIYERDYHLAYLINGVAGGIVTLATVIVAGSLALRFGAARLSTWLAWGAILTFVAVNGPFIPALVATLAGGTPAEPLAWFILAASMAFDLVSGGAAGVFVWVVVRPDRRLGEFHRRRMQEASATESTASTTLEVLPRPAERAIDRILPPSFRLLLAAIAVAILLPAMTTTAKLLIFSIADPERDLSNWHLAYLTHAFGDGIVTFVVVLVACFFFIRQEWTDRRSSIVGGALIAFCVGNSPTLLAIGTNVTTLGALPFIAWLPVGAPALLDLPLGAATGFLIWALVRPDRYSAKRMCSASAG